MIAAAFKGVNAIALRSLVAVLILRNKEIPFVARRTFSVRWPQRE